MISVFVGFIGRLPSVKVARFILYTFPIILALALAVSPVIVFDVLKSFNTRSASAPIKFSINKDKFACSKLSVPPDILSKIFISC